MRLAPSFPFLRRATDRTPVRAQDPADLGTAFGLEASLEEFHATPASYGQLESQREHPPLDNPMAWVKRPRS